MRTYINVYGNPGKEFSSVFTALVQNSENIADVMKDYDEIGLIYISRNSDTFTAMKKEGVYGVGPFSYDVMAPRKGRILAQELHMWTWTGATQVDMLEEVEDVLPKLTDAQVNKLFMSDSYPAFSNVQRVPRMEYSQILDAVTEEVEHLGLYAQGIPVKEHHKILTPAFREKRIQTFKPFELSSADRRRLYRPGDDELFGWSISYVPVIKSRK